VRHIRLQPREAWRRPGAAATIDGTGEAMDIQFNYAAVITAAILAFAVGGLWYSPVLFSRTWMREAGVDEDLLRQRNMGVVFGLTLVCNLVAAFNLAAFIGPKGSLSFGTLAGLATGLGWVAMALAVIYLFERRSLKLWLVNAGYQVVAFTLMGAVIGVWR
jgi:hypothetical protein